MHMLYQATYRLSKSSRINTACVNSLFAFEPELLFNAFIPEKHSL